MAIQLDIEDLFKLSENIPLLDVRSLKEFEHAHIPGAISFPLFSNEERAKVGISYKNEGKQPAILQGLEFVGPKLAYFAKEALKLAVDNQLIVHCWRGGMRSASMAWLFNTLGIKTYVLEGGYKAYRQFIKNQFAKDIKLVVLGGMTGSGKTELLKELQRSGEQVVDLEGIASHRGSAFGALGQNEQTTTEQFENNLYETWRTFDLSEPIWLEDESKNIGKVSVPDELFKKMRITTVINLDIPINIRVDYLLEEYGTFSPKELKESVSKIKKRLGGKNHQLAIDLIDKGELKGAVEIILSYYDKAYKFGLSKRNTLRVHPVSLQSIHHSANAKKVLNYYQSLKD